MRQIRRWNQKWLHLFPCSSSFSSSWKHFVLPRAVIGALRAGRNPPKLRADSILYFLYYTSYTILPLLYMVKMEQQTELCALPAVIVLLPSNNTIKNVPCIFLFQIQLCKNSVRVASPSPTISRQTWRFLLNGVENGFIHCECCWSRKSDMLLREGQMWAEMFLCSFPKWTLDSSPPGPSCIKALLWELETTFYLGIWSVSAGHSYVFLFFVIELPVFQVFSRHSGSWWKSSLKFKRDRFHSEILVSGHEDGDYTSTHFWSWYESCIIRTTILL